MNENLCLYAIQNKEGEWFRRKGLNGSGESWVDNFEQARVFSKIGTARGVVSWWANKYPSYGTPFLVILYIGRVEKQNEADKIAESKRKRDELYAKKELQWKEKKIIAAQKDYEESRKKLKELRKK